MSRRVLSPREAALLATAVCIVGLGAFFVLRCVPHVRTLPASEGDVAKEAPDRSVLQAEIERLADEHASLEASLESVRARLGADSARRAPPSEAPRVASEVSAIAARSGLDVQSSEVLVGAEAAGELARDGRAASRDASRTVLRLAATGSYAAVEAFVAGLGGLDVPVALRRFELLRVEGAAGGGPAVRLEVLLVP